jgi:hypothetical protein
MCDIDACVTLRGLNEGKERTPLTYDINCTDIE